tara:strand:+ start:1098 stop:1385 length:288 start_codon:yes stop_codon:yes gene_type:complete
MSKKNLTKIMIAKELGLKTGFSISFSKKLIDDLILCLIERIKTEKFNLKNLGTFKIINKNERKGRNPKTKEQFVITARKTISFIPSKKILKDLNE